MTLHIFGASQINASLLANGTRTFEYNTSGSTSVIVLGLAGCGTVSPTTGSPTFAGVAMKQVGTAASQRAVEMTVQLWYQLNPARGACTLSIVVGTNNAHAVTVSACVPSGCESALDVSSIASGTVASASVGFTTACDGAFIVDRLGHGVGAVATGQDFTLLYSADHGAHTSYAQYGIQANSGVTSVGWGQAADDWAQAAVAFKVVAASTPGPPGAAITRGFMRPMGVW